MEKLLMNVRLVSHTIACDDFDFIATPTELVAFCARVSNPSNQNNRDSTEKLINYLIKWKHWSPFEMVNATLEIETTRDIARQILRHRSFTFQEFSQRYADPVKELTFETREARLQDQKNRQNSIDTEDAWLQQEWERTQQDVIRVAVDAYKWAIDKGIAKEVARAVLPEGLTTSRMYVNGTLRSWIHYIETRTHISTQKEHREIAKACAKAIAVIFPLINNFSQNETADAK
jgi:thymidylate synthase (FAD)